MTLRRKLLIPLFFIGLLLASFGAYFAYRTSRAQLEAWMLDRARLVAASIRGATDSAISEDQIQRVVDTMGRFEGVTEIVVVAHDPPRVIATNVESWRGKSLRELPGANVRDDLEKVLASADDSYDTAHADGTLIDYSAPLRVAFGANDGGPKPAAMMIHLSSRSLQVESEIAAWRSVTLVTLTVLAMSAAAYLVVVMMILRPTSSVIRTLAARAAGSRDARSPVVAKDEIGAVAATLNSMLDTIDREESMRHAAEQENRLLLDQLKRECDRAQAGEEAKSEFLATISHEIRTPLNGILGFANLLKESRLDVDQLEYVRTLQQSAGSLLDLLNDVLDFSKIEAGEMKMESAPFDLEAIVGEVAELFLEPSARKGVALVVDVAADAPTRMIGDARRVRQVLLNLVGNAVKFTSRGDIRIVVERSDETAGAPARPRVEVRDTGIGIEEQHRHKLFQRFQQVDVSTTRQYGGTGLGLAICKRLVEKMAGRIGIESTSGVGSTFWFTLGLPIDPRATKKIHEVSAGEARVLIVSDRPAIRDVLQNRLRQFGLIAEFEAQPKRALLALERDGDRGPSRLIVDRHVLAGCDSAILDELIERARAIGCRIVAIARPQERRDAVSARFDLVLCEPVARSELLFEAIAADSQALPAAPPATAAPSGAAATAAAETDAVESVTAASAPAISSELTSEKPAPLRRLRVLLAEDNAVNQKLAVKMLTLLGCEVDVVNNGEDAVARVLGQEYDLVLMDCQMPELDGFEATRRIREAEPPSRRTPIVALTANALAEDRVRCLAAGMDGYITKPFRREELRHALARFVNLDDGGPAVDSPASSP